MYAVNLRHSLLSTGPASRLASHVSGNDVLLQPQALCPSPHASAFRSPCGGGVHSCYALGLAGVIFTNGRLVSTVRTTEPSMMLYKCRWKTHSFSLHMFHPQPVPVIVQSQLLPYDLEAACSFRTYMLPTPICFSISTPLQPHSQRCHIRSVSVALQLPSTLISSIRSTTRETRSSQRRSNV